MLKSARDHGQKRSAYASPDLTQTDVTFNGLSFTATRDINPVICDKTSTSICSKKKKKRTPLLQYPVKPSKTPNASHPFRLHLRKMAWRSGSLSRSLISTVRSSSLRSPAPLPRHRPSPLAAPRVQSRRSFAAASRTRSPLKP